MICVGVYRLLWLRKAPPQRAINTAVLRQRSTIPSLHVCSLAATKSHVSCVASSSPPARPIPLALPAPPAGPILLYSQSCPPPSGPIPLALSAAPAFLAPSPIRDNPQVAAGRSVSFITCLQAFFGPLAVEGTKTPMALCAQIVALFFGRP